MLVQKFFPKFIFSKQIWSQKVWFLQIIGPKNFGHKNILVLKPSFQKVFFVQTNFWFKKMFGP